MKKLLLSAAIVSFFAFATHAQTPAANPTDAKKENTSVKAPDAPTSKASCVKGSSGCCKAKGTASTESSSKSCCKGKDAKACGHDGTKAEGTTDVKTADNEKVSAHPSK